MLCGIAGAVTHLLFHFGDMTPVIGASAAISGQMAGALRFFFNAKPLPGGAGAGFCRGADHEPRPNAERQADADGARIWIAMNAYFGISAVQIGGQEGNIAWEAHIGGFLCGLFIFGAFDRGQAGRG